VTIERRISPIALAILAVAAAGCGGGKPATPGVAQVATTTATTTTSSRSGGSPTGASKAEDVRRFSVCMRSNGVPRFPDPKPSGNGMSLTIGPGSGIDPSSPQFKAAQKSCEKLLPSGGKADPAMQAKARAQALRFSACMRSHGLPSFPDPTFSGGGIQLSVGRALNPNSPVFKAAQKACESITPGPKGGGGSYEMGPAPVGGDSAP
jgi:hypothetical protein